MHILIFLLYEARKIVKSRVANYLINFPIVQHLMSFIFSFFKHIYSFSYVFTT